jgi:hypothetical protein
MPAGDRAKTSLRVVRERLGDLEGVTWTDATLYLLLNGAQRTLAQLLADGALWGLQEVAALTVVGSPMAADLPADFLRERAVWLDEAQAQRRSVDTLDELTRALTMPTDEHPAYMIWDGAVHFYASTVRTTSGSLWYIREPVDMSGSVDPDIPEALTDAMETWAVALALAGDDTRAQEHDYLLTLFGQQVAAVNLRFGPGGVKDVPPADPRRSGGR